MTPSDQRLLKGAQDTLKAAIDADSGADRVTALNTVKLLLDELALRNDNEFWDDYHSAGKKLLQNAVGLLTHETETQRGTRAGLEAVYASGDLQANARPPIETLHRALASLVTDLAPRAPASAAISQLLTQVVDWENSLYALRSQNAAAREPTGQTSNEPFTAASIERYLGMRFPADPDSRVSGVRKVAGGFSKSTIMFDVDGSAATRRTLVIRAEQRTSLVFLEGANIENEYYVLCLARAAGIPVAEPLWLEKDATHFGVRFLVSDKAPGRNVGTAVGLSEAFSNTLLVDLVRNLFRIHQTKVLADNDNVRLSHLGRWLQFHTLTESNQQNIAYWREIIASLDLPASPIVARALDWLERHVPRCDEAPTLVHRDYGGHNILVDNDRIACILDWESATVGDPAEDLAWMTNSMRGQVDRQRIFDLYADMSGRPVPMDRVRFFDVLTSLKYAVTCLQALSIFDKQPAAPASLCQLGLIFMHHGTGELNRCIEAAENA